MVGIKMMQILFNEDPADVIFTSDIEYNIKDWNSILVKNTIVKCWEMGEYYAISLCIGTLYSTTVGYVYI